MKRFICLFFFLTLVVKVCFAGYNVNPVILKFNEAENKSSDVVTISHDGYLDMPIALQIKIMSRKVNEEGSPEYSELKNPPFIIYPQQVILQKGDIQKIQIKWLRKNIPNHEIAYGLLYDQVDIDFSEEKKEYSVPQGKVIALIRTEGAILVKPKNKVKSNLVVTNTSLIKKDSENLLKLKFYNKGTARAKLFGKEITVIPIDDNNRPNYKRRYSFVPKYPSKKIIQSLFPGDYRVVEIPWPVRIPLGKVKVIVD